MGEGWPYWDCLREVGGLHQRCVWSVSKGFKTSNRSSFLQFCVSVFSADSLKLYRKNRSKSGGMHADGTTAACDSFLVFISVCGLDTLR